MVLQASWILIEITFLKEITYLKLGYFLGNAMKRYIADKDN